MKDMKGMKGLPVNPERLQWCLRHYCLTPAELAKRAGLKPSTVRRACGGEQGLTLQEMRAITKALELNSFFFIQENNISREEVRIPQFRAAAGQPRRTTEMLLLSRTERRRRYFEGLFEDLPALKPRKVSYPQLRPGDGYEAKARMVRRWLKLSGGAGFAELRQKVEAKGILVFVGCGTGRWQVPKDGRGREQFKSFALRHEVLPIIFVAKERDERNQSFTLLHELAHLIMHQKDAIDGERSLASCHGAS